MILTTGMAHQRKLIRDAVVALLISANTAAGARVESTRVNPYRPVDLPAIAVYTLSESTDPDSAQTAPVELTRNLKLEIVGHVAHTSALHVEDAMDALAEQIEAAMAADYYIADTVVDQMLESTDIEVRNGDGQSDPLVGIVALSYAITYRTSPAAPTGLGDFTTVDAKHKVQGGVVDTVPAEDTFTVQEIAP